MRVWLARLVHPRMCGAKIQIVTSYRGPDRWDEQSATVIKGVDITCWQTCGKPVGHDGGHGGWSRWFKWRTKFVNWIDPS